MKRLEYSAVRNIVNPQDMDEAIKENFGTRNEGDKIDKWLMTVVKNQVMNNDHFFMTIDLGNIADWSELTGLPGPIPPWAKKVLFGGGSVEVFIGGAGFSAMRDDVEHAVGYLKTLLADNSNANIQNIPYDKAVKEGDALVKQKIRNKEEEDGDTEVVLDTGSGFKWVSIQNSKGLPRESKHMGHCVGNPIFMDNYGTPLDEGKIAIWSLRDSGNKPHCTIQIMLNEKYCAQIKGKQNAGLIPKYIMHLVKLMNSPRFDKVVNTVSDHDMQINCITKTDNHGYVTWHNPPKTPIKVSGFYGLSYNMSSNTVVTESFESYYPFPLPTIDCSNLKLPKAVCRGASDLTVIGQLSLDNTKVEGKLVIAANDARIKDMDIEANGHLDLLVQGDLTAENINSGSASIVEALVKNCDLHIGKGKMTGVIHGDANMLKLHKFNLDLLLDNAARLSLHLKGCYGTLRMPADRIYTALTTDNPELRLVPY